MNKITKIIIVSVLVLVVAVVIATKENKKTDLQSKPETFKALPRLLDLGSDKCVPCKMMEPILEELKEEYAGTFGLEFIDVWKNQDAGNKYNIRVIPTQIFFDAAGKELFRHEGFFSKADILAKWKELGVNIEKMSE